MLVVWLEHRCGFQRDRQWKIRGYLEGMPTCFLSSLRCTNNNDHQFD